MVYTLALGVALLLAATGICAAQTGTAGLRGKVADAQGAVIPGATVTLTNNATGLTRETFTDATGDFSFVSLPPGTYTLRVSLQGFRTAVFTNVPLPVDTVARQDARLEIGHFTETVEVTAVTTVINTSDASLGNVINGSQLGALPLEARSVAGLLNLQPGAVFVPTNAWGDLDNRSGAVSGARADQANVTLDGVDDNDPQLQHGVRLDHWRRTHVHARPEQLQSARLFGHPRGGGGVQLGRRVDHPARHPGPGQRQLRVRQGREPAPAGGTNPPALRDGRVRVLRPGHPMMAPSTRRSTTRWSRPTRIRSSTRFGPAAYFNAQFASPNTPRFDVGNVTMFPDRTSTFGTYEGTYATCDGNAGRCMQFSLRYEF